MNFIKLSVNVVHGFVVLTY